MRKWLFTLILLATPLICKAQFYSSGNESPAVKWSYIQSPNYKIIYPRGLDSLAGLYARTLESAVLPVSRSIGYTPNQSYRRPLPVVLHTYTGYSNGMVAWTPRRMELMTLPDVLAPASTPWHQHLIIHESRHAAQMQFTAAKPYRWTRVISGQMIGAGINNLYCEPAFSEGDAVATETALTRAGRGRTADFLEYYRVSFAAGDMRNYTQWTYNAQDRFTPDHYKSGYITFAGLRSVFGVDDYTAAFYDNIAAHGGLVFYPADKVLKPRIGLKFKEAYAQICDNMRLEWQKDEEERAPFMPSDTITGSRRYFTEYTDLCVVDDAIYAVRNGLTLPTELVCLSEDKERRVCSISGIHSTPQYSPSTDRLYWCEYQGHTRWEQQSYSTIYYLENGRKKALIRRTRYFHPAPSKDADLLAATELAYDGRAAIVVLDALSGELLVRYPCPDGLQPVESVWVGDELFYSAISDDGFGLYRAEDSAVVLSPVQSKIKQLREFEDNILFVCDRTSVNELYSLDPQSRELHQLSVTRFGLADFSFSSDGAALFYSTLSPDGRNICATRTNDLLLRPCSLADKREQPLVQGLVESERRVWENQGLAWSENDMFAPMPLMATTTGVEQVECDTVAISEPRKYRKWGKSKLHSWLPLYADYDELDVMSFEEIGTVANLGATLFFQNDLGTLDGHLGVAAMDADWNWRPNGHIKLTWRGWYPVVEYKMSINKSGAYKYYFSPDAESKPKIELFYSPDAVSLSQSFKVYVPINLSRGGWQRGIIPEVSCYSSIDGFFTSEEYSFGNPILKRGQGVPMSVGSMSLRAYTMEGITNSRIFPRLGIGTEMGYCTRPNLETFFGGSAYLNLYGYLPGIWPTHGLRMSLLRVRNMEGPFFPQPFVYATPRGFSFEISQVLAEIPYQTKVGVEYAMPVLPLNVPILGRLAVIRNFELLPHAEFAYYNAPKIFGAGNQQTLASAGLDINVRLNSLMWVVGDYRAGITFDYLFGSLMPFFKENDLCKKPYKIGVDFSVDF